MRYLSLFTLGLALSLLPGVIYHQNFTPPDLAHNLYTFQVVLTVLTKVAATLTFVFSDSPLGDYQGLAVVVCLIVVLGGIFGFQPWS